jgi:hypothetical protein
MFVQYIKTRETIEKNMACRWRCDVRLDGIVAVVYSLYHY